ncbi:hypothetical protein [Paenibacillus silvae]|nr:hypothetical protein [Paenibacillus silvae]MCK6148613.1 hypothetical protein [Paenibacillus silvae]
MNRFIKQKIGIEKSNYRQTLKGLLEMIKWNHGFEAKQKKEILEILKPYNHKLVIVKNNNDIINKSGSLLSEL